MMEISDIARVTYELMRQREDRVLMMWEGEVCFQSWYHGFCNNTHIDDRAHLLREIRRLHVIHDRDVRTTEKLKLEMSVVTKKIHQLAAVKVDDAEKRPSQRRNSDRIPTIVKRSDLKQKLLVDLVSSPSVGSTHNDIKPSQRSAPSVEFITPTAYLTGHTVHSSNSSEERKDPSGLMPAGPTPTPHPPPAPYPTYLNLYPLSDKYNSRGPHDSTHPPTAAAAPYQDTVKPPPPTTATNPPPQPYIDTGGRKRNIRDMLDGHECEECKRYYRVMEQQGLITDTSDLKETLRKCSRHKSRWSSPEHAPLPPLTFRADKGWFLILRSILSSVI